MPEYLVLLLVQITIFSSVTALLLLAVKFVFRRRIPPELSLLLWLILLVRVALPGLPESVLSIYNLIPAGRQIQYTLTHNSEAGAGELPDAVETTAENPYRFHSAAERDDSLDAASIPQDSVAAVETTAPVDWQEFRQQFCTVVLALYGCGIVLSVIFHGILYEQAIRRVYRSSCRCEDPRILQIYTETAAGMRIMDRKAPPLRLGNSTMLAGVLAPCVILQPENQSAPGEAIPEPELRMIFLHELNHFKHGDNWILLLSTVFCLIFWYNPLLWLVRKMLREDIEVLCDARTLETCGIEAGEYARMLCRSSRLPDLSLQSGMAMSASGRNLKLRLQLISNRRKGAFLPRVVSVLLCTAMIALCLTNPMVSANSAFTPYIERLSAITDDSVRDITLNEQVTVGQFLQWADAVLVYAGDNSLSRKTGGGDLNALVRLARMSPYVSGDIAAAAAGLTPESRLNLESCTLLLACITGILGEGRFVTELPLLPEMLSAEAMETVCSQLTEEEAKQVLACYNIGVDGAQVEFSYVYTEAMMKLIRSRLQNDWAREKLAGYYQKVNLSARDLDKINAYLNNTVRYVGMNRDFYICDPALARHEEETLRRILGAASAGEREDVYYLKQTADNCSFETAAQLLTMTGMNPLWYQAEYALMGETTYDCISAEQFFLPDGSIWVNALQLDSFAEKLQNEYLDAGIAEWFVYHDTLTYTAENGSRTEISMRYYEAAEDRADICRNALLWMTEQLNAVAFSRPFTAEKLPVTDAVSAGTLEACTLAAEMGLVYFGSGPVSVEKTLTSGQCAKILCRYLASMTNAY